MTNQPTRLPSRITGTLQLPTLHQIEGQTVQQPKMSTNSLLPLEFRTLPPIGPVGPGPISIQSSITSPPSSPTYTEEQLERLLLPKKEESKKLTVVTEEEIIVEQPTAPTIVIPSVKSISLRTPTIVSTVPTISFSDAVREFNNNNVVDFKHELVDLGPYSNMTLTTKDGFKYQFKGVYDITKNQVLPVPMISFSEVKDLFTKQEVVDFKIEPEYQYLAGALKNTYNIATITKSNGTKYISLLVFDQSSNRITPHPLVKFNILQALINSGDIVEFGVPEEYQDLSTKEGVNIIKVVDKRGQIFLAEAKYDRIGNKISAPE